MGVLYAAVLIASAAFMTRWPKLLPEAPRETVKKTSALKLLDFDYKSQAIGIVRLDGLIAMERRGSFFGETTIDRLEKNLERMAKKRHVKAIILRINSPGGTVASSQELYRSIRDLRQKYRKPVIALLGDVAASGGFYVASACDKIVAEPGTITGSIGVIFQSGHFDGLLRRYGIEFNTIKSGPYKDIGNPFRPMKPEEKEILQNLIDTAYSQFIMAVAEGRNMPPDKVKELADGRIWAGQQAAQIKMIDEDTGFKGAIELAKNLGKISGEPRLIWDGDLREDILESFLKGETGARFLGLIPATGITAVGALDYAKLPPSGRLYLWTGYWYDAFKTL
ncbi:MAG: signal peptide peptidase SppA [Elusimicrobia bacterium]|nr:signal peptide peptidase SppA [Elusimicrobiota bacterium]